jgi:phage tail protein X
MDVVVKQGETITDIILNNTGDIINWNAVLDANPAVTDWTQILTVGQVITIPDTVAKNLNNIRQFALYPLNNASIATVYDQIIDILNSMLFIETTAITEVTSTAAVSGGVINNPGSAVTQKGVCWSVSPSPTTAGSKTTEGAGNGVFISNLTGLLGSQLYYVRAYAVTAAGTVYGNEVSFTTEAIAVPIILTTIAQANYTANKGTLLNMAYILKVQNLSGTAYNYITTIIGSIYGQAIAADIATNGLNIYTNTTPNMSGTPVLIAGFNPAGTLFDSYTANLLTVTIPAGGIIYIIVTVDIDAAATTAHTLHVDGTDPLLLTITGAPAQQNNQTDIAALITIGV